MRHLLGLIEHEESINRLGDFRANLQTRKVGRLVNTVCSVYTFDLYFLPMDKPKKGSCRTSELSLLLASYEFLNESQVLT